ncbi:hypothetical protein KHA96_11975 [Bacillus sp. FJAT-49711]|uniref:hypothetical protein n=1 Tax=Bacillus sp. FJAT-49711 TaxID=2833585 RepID=UPI001BC9E2D6|nr:hypothetical protein [Bacillus sp. FJAT-49711]MBS4219034.1 hypothetical protein [Bacillus sp. FJAT-49711]
MYGRVPRIGTNTPEISNKIENSFISLLYIKKTKEYYYRTGYKYMAIGESIIEYIVYLISMSLHSFLPSGDLNPIQKNILVKHWRDYEEQLLLCD